MGQEVDTGQDGRPIRPGRDRFGDGFAVDHDQPGAGGADLAGVQEHRGERVVEGDLAIPELPGGFFDAVVSRLLLMYLRYGAHLSGRRLAQFTLLAFLLMLVALLAAHPFVPGDTR